MATASAKSASQIGYKIDIDDTIPLNCLIEATETNNDHVVSFDILKFNLI